MGQVAVLSRWPAPFPAEYACAWGDDVYGLWMEISVPGATPDAAPVIQRFRWIEPGKFMIGSPEEEPLRYRSEGPRHLVKLTAGYWLADTVCTQALWVAVMGHNPSGFPNDAECPVEQVSSEDVQAFMDKLNAMIAGLGAGLPTEAQWEYACRAGTGTPFWFGDQITPAQVNYDGNYPYADGAKGEYRERTVPVKALAPNGWGLYQMHGNVWEWCADGLREYAETDATDPAGPAGGDRAVRGGSWHAGAGGARSAHRIAFDQDDRINFLGFRLCLRSMEPGAPRRGAEAGRDCPPLDDDEVSEEPSGAVLGVPVQGTDRATRLHGQASQPLGLSSSGAPADRVSSFASASAAPPSWAERAGEDQFGRWVEIQIRGVRQRFRGIDAGEFWMGSPDDEQQRYPNEGPRHRVRLTESYWLADTACTQALWLAVVGRNPSRFQDDVECPVERVSWQAAMKFAAQLALLVPGVHAGLPTEAQWEYACRAGTETPFWFGANITTGQVNCDGNYPYAGGAKGAYRERTVPVKALPPNGWGLYQMHGNVWEWCADGLRPYRSGEVTNPRGPDKSDRVMRGASWKSNPRSARSAYRRARPPDRAHSGLGFRLCLASG